MSFPKLYLSRPGVAFPSNRYNNNDILALVRKEYTGSSDGWTNIHAAIQKVFDKCNTQYRYLDFDADSRVAQYAVKSVEHCVSQNRLTLKEIIDDIDLVIFGGIAREYFEPATAMEVAATLGIKETHAFDVTTACVGHLEALQVACAQLAIRDDYNTALVCTSELSREFLSFDIQSTADLYLKAAGLTIGNAAACMLVRRTPWPNGSVRLISADTFTVPGHWDLGQVPIHGSFISSAVETMKLHKYIAPRLRKVFKKLGWKPEDIDHFVFHQPSEFMTRKIIKAVKADESKGVYTHHLYGNNASATVGVVYDQLLKERNLKTGDRVLLGSAASGFTMVVAAGEWVEK